MPVVDIAAGKRGTRLLRAKHIAWGMTCATMGQTFDQIGAPVPLRSLCAVRLVGPAFQKKQLPTGNGETLIERKSEIVGMGRRSDGGPRHQERIQRAIVLVIYIGEMVVREGRIEMAP